MKEKIKSFRKEGKKGLEHWEFLNSGLACHALCLLEQAGALSKLKKASGKLLHSSIKRAKNPHLLRAALSTLVGAKVVILEKEGYCLTDLGRSLTENIGALLLPFLGYRNLLAKQDQLLDDPNNWSDDEIDYQSIALSSINFGASHLDPVLVDLVKYIHPKGTICDLGCGTAEKLFKICKETNTSGLGLEKCKSVIKESRKFTRNNAQVEVVEADITDLQGVWEDVELGLISFVLHDVHPEKECVKFLNSLKDHFPRMQCLIVVDIVFMSKDVPSIMPGFDYVHGLQGVTSRNYAETLKAFSKSDFTLVNEILVPNMPNTFIWTLNPN